MEYFYNTDIAKFVIRTEPQGMWNLWVNEMLTLTFATPELAAAYAVFEQKTGFIGWDDLAEHQSPASLPGWTETA